MNQSQILVLCAALFAVLVKLSWGFSVPYVPDEVGYLAIARYLATGEAFNLSTVSHYSFGQALVLLPGSIACKSPESIYQAGIIISCLATAVVPMVLLGIGGRMCIERTPNVIACAFLAAVMPAYFFNNFLVWSEATFRLSFLITVYLFASAIVTKNRWCYFGFALSVVWLFAIHPRALSLIPIAIVALVLAQLLRASDKLTAYFAVAICVAGYWLTSELNDHFEATIWGAERVQSEQIATLLWDFTTLNGWKRAITACAGQVWVLCAESLGLFPLGIFFGLQLAKSDGVRAAVLAFVLVASIGVLLASVAQMMSLIGDSRIDQVIYGRYNNALSTLFVWLGLVAVAQSRLSAKVSTGIALTIVVTAALALIGTRNASVSVLVAPNVSGLLWSTWLIRWNDITLPTLVVLGSLLAIAVTSTALTLRTLSLPLFAASAIMLDSAVYDRAIEAQAARQLYVVASRAVYAKAPGPVYWDNSAAGNGHVMIDQYSSYSRPMQQSDIATSGLAKGQSAVIAPGMALPADYTSLGILPDGSQLVLKSN